jgi:hypothetical protein
MSELAEELIHPDEVKSGHKLYSMEFYEVVGWTPSLIKKFIKNNKMNVDSYRRTYRGWKLIFYPRDMFSSFSSEPKDAYNMIFGELKKKTHNIIE